MYYSSIPSSSLCARREQGLIRIDSEESSFADEALLVLSS